MAKLGARRFGFLLFDLLGGFVAGGFPKGPTPSPDALHIGCSTGELSLTSSAEEVQ